MTTLKPLQDIKSCTDFVKRANSLWASGCNYGSLIIELGREMNSFEESGAWKSESKTCAEFFKKHLPWYNERRIRALKHVARCKDATELIESMGEPLQIPDKPKKNKKSSTNQSDVSSAAVVISTTRTDEGSLSPAAVVTAKKPAKIVDDMGTPIPEPLLELWNRRGEIEELMTAVSKVKCHINAFRSDKDELFCKVSQQVTEHLASAYSLLKDAVPSCLCGICEGRLEILKDNFCKACSSTGFMSEREYKLLVPEEKRKIRKLANAQHNGK